MQVDLLAVFSEASLVAASDSEHVHAVHLQSIDHGTGPFHLIQPLPRRGGARGARATPHGSGSPGPALELHREVPGRSRVLRKAPAQKQLVVSQRLLSVDDGSERRCGAQKKNVSTFTYFDS